MRYRNFKIKGFSLLELLLAVTLMASISAIMMVMIFQSRRMDEAAQSAIKTRQTKRLIKNLIQKDLSAAVYLNNFKTVNSLTGIYGRDLKDFGNTIDQIYMNVHQPSLNSLLNDEYKDPLLHDVYYVTIKTPNQSNTYSLYRLERFYINREFKIVNNVPSPSQFNDPDFEVSLVYDKILSISIKYIPSDPAKLGALANNWSSSLEKDGYKLPAAVVFNIKLLNTKNEPEELNFEYNIRPDINQLQWDF